MNVDRPGVAVIGCGAWGMNHVRVWHDLGCLKAVCDVDPIRLSTIKERYPGIEIYTQVEEVLKHPDICAVIIATPASIHANLALKALESDKDVFVEKPLALNVIEGEKIVNTATKRNLILMVGHILEYHPAINTLKELIVRGELGRIQYIYSHRLNIGRIRTEENVLWSFAPHDISVLLHLLEQMPETIICTGGAYLNNHIPDVTLMNLYFSNNVRAHIFVSWLHPFKEHRFVVVGDKQMAVFDDTQSWENKLVLYPHRIDWIGGQIPVAHKAEGIPVPLKEIEPLRAECEHFLECIKYRKTPLTDGENGLNVLKILEVAQQSLQQGGQPITFKKKHSVYIHPTATIDSNVEIGENTKIWHYTHIMSGARIGKNCILGQNVFVGRNVRIGNGVKIQNNVSVYEGVELEDFVFCGPSVVFTNVINPRSEIERKSEFRRTLVKRGATLGANCTILCGITIGRYAFVGAGAVVTKDVPDYALVVGVPARIVGWVCECAQKLHFDEEGFSTCQQCGKLYRYINGRVERIS